MADLPEARLRALADAADTETRHPFCRDALIAYAASPDRVRAIAAVVEAARRVCAEVGYGLATSQRIDALRAAVHALDGLDGGG